MKIVNGEKLFPLINVSYPKEGNFTRENIGRIKFIFANQFVIFKPLSYCFEETIGFDVKASFASRPVSCLIRLYNKPGDIK